MQRLIPHIGLRTVKTGLAVALALFFAELRGSPAPAFAGLGAIAGTTRTLKDSLRSCWTQLLGILLGAGFGGVCAALFGPFRYAGAGLGVIGLILLCVRLRLHFAVPLASIVFVSVCLSPAAEAFAYGLNRLTDTAIGLFIALALNIILKPYNNLARIGGLIDGFLRMAAACVEERVLHGRYPELAPLTETLSSLSDEIDIFERQNIFRLPDHRGQTVYLRGCAQLAQAILQELYALCAMEERGLPSEENAAAIREQLGLAAPAGLAAAPRTAADAVENYHLAALLRAHRYLSELRAAE